MTGKTIILGMLAIALLTGGSIYYLQVYAYYEDVTAQVEKIQLTSASTGQLENIMFENVKAIDSNSSPLRYRACFEVTQSLDALTATYEIYDDIAPRIAPGWFDCFDAEQIGNDLEAGLATGFLGVKDFKYGIDRVVAVYPDGRAYSWHHINPCGDVVFDGRPAPADCPPVPESLK